MHSLALLNSLNSILHSCVEVLKCYVATLFSYFTVFYLDVLCRCLLFIPLTPLKNWTGHSSSPNELCKICYSLCWLHLTNPPLPLSPSPFHFNSLSFILTSFFWVIRVICHFCACWSFQLARVLSKARDTPNSIEKVANIKYGTLGFNICLLIVFY